MQHHIAHLKVFADGQDFRAYSYWMVPGQLLADRSAKERRMHDGMPQGLPWQE
jgi:hypothetical protein